MKLRHGRVTDVHDPVATPAALLAANGNHLRVGVPVPFPTQAELGNRWLASSAIARGLTIHTLPPPMMVDALAQNEVSVLHQTAVVSENVADESRAGCLL